MTKLIVGLGNPGKQYERTRHNAGYLAVDFLAKELKLKWREDKKLGASIVRADKIILAKPTKLMNNSGSVVTRLLKHFNIPQKNLTVVYDDVDLPLGELRLREKGSSAGHKGMQSVIDQLQTTNLSRLKIGIGSPNIDTAEFVLRQFTAKEMTAVKAVLPQVIEMLL